MDSQKAKFQEYEADNDNNGSKMNLKLQNSEAEIATKQKQIEDLQVNKRPKMRIQSLLLITSLSKKKEDDCSNYVGQSCMDPEKTFEALFSKEVCIDCRFIQNYSLTEWNFHDFSSVRNAIFDRKVTRIP